MGTPGPRTTNRYSEEFKATAVQLSKIAGVRVNDVAESLCIYPLMLSRCPCARAAGCDPFSVINEPRTHPLAHHRNF